MSTVVGLGLSFGQPFSLKSNQLIADELLKFRGSDYKVAIVCDTCVFVNLPKTTKSVFRIGSYDSEDHCSTLVLAEEFVYLAKQNGWHIVTIISEDNYSERAVRDIEEIAKKVKWTMRVSVSRNIKSVNFFCLESKQIWTRYKTLSFVREFILRRLTPFWLYELITGR